MLAFLPVLALAANVAEQVHIMYQGQNANGNPSGMNVAWYTQDEVATPWVRFGLSADNLNATATGSSVQYYKKHGHHHSVDLENLQPATRYYYQVQGATDDEDSAVFSFKTAPDVTSIPGGFSLSWFGDMGYLGSAERPELLPVGGMKRNWSAVPTRKTLEDLYNKGEFEFVWHVGDVSYADDAFGTDVVGGKYEGCFNGFMNWMQNISANVPYAVLPGNHESECHSPECVADPLIGRQLANFSAYNARFHMPSAPSGGVLSMWYSFNYGPAHFVNLNTETDFVGAGEEHRGDSGIFPAGSFAPNGTYMAWLEADLKAAHEARTAGGPNARKWIIAGGHRPCCSNLPGVQALFDKYEVDLYVSGHEHTYARSIAGCAEPACSNSVQPPSTGKTSYVFCGGAGNDETAFITTGPSPVPGSQTFATPELSTCMLKINETAINHMQISSIDQRIIDSFIIQ